MNKDGKMASQDADNSFSRVFMKTIFITIINVSVPALIGIGLGILVDARLGTMPIAVLTGAALGFALAAALVARQIKQVKGRR